MLQAQVNYWNLQENIRHNLATEKLGSDTLTETIRHNKETESQGRSSLSIESGKLGAMLRSNEINYFNAMNNARRNEIESFNAQTNRMVGMGNLAVNRTNAASQAVQAQASAKQAQNAAQTNSIRSQELYYKNVERAADVAMRGVESLTKLGGLYYGRK